MDLKKNYERLFGKIKPLQTEVVYKLTEDEKKRFNNLSSRLAMKYPNAPLTLREGYVYFGYKKYQSVEDFMKRSSNNITEAVRTFSQSGKQGLL